MEVRQNLLQEILWFRKFCSFFVDAGKGICLITKFTAATKSNSKNSNTSGNVKKISSPDWICHEFEKIEDSFARYIYFHLVWNIDDFSIVETFQSECISVHFLIYIIYRSTEFYQIYFHSERRERERERERDGNPMKSFFIVPATPCNQLYLILSCHSWFPIESTDSLKI